MSFSRGIKVPLTVIGFNPDGFRGGELLAGEGSSFFSVFLNLASGFRSVDGQKASLEHAGLTNLLVHIEVNGVTVNKGLDSYVCLYCL